MVEVVIFILALIGYGSQGRDWLEVQLGGEWGVGVLEGLILAVFIYYFFKTYGKAIDEILSGLRELGRLKKPPKDKK